MLYFENDYSEGAHDKVLEALIVILTPFSQITKAFLDMEVMSTVKELKKK